LRISPSLTYDLCVSAFQLGEAKERTFLELGSVRTDILKQRFGLMDRITRAIPIFLELLQTSFLKHELRVQRRATQAEMAIRGVI